MKWIKTEFGVFNLDQVTNLHISDDTDVDNKQRWVNVDFCDPIYYNSLESSNFRVMAVFTGNYDQCRTAIGQMLSGDFDMKVDYMHNLRSSRWIDIDDHVFNLKHVSNFSVDCHDNEEKYSVSIYLPNSVYREDKYQTHFCFELMRKTKEECTQLIDDIVYGKYDIEGV